MIKPRTTRDQAVDASNLAEMHRLVTAFRKPFDLSIEIDLEALVHELRRAEGSVEKPVLPTDGGVYHLLYFKDPSDPEQQIPILLPEQYTPWVLFGMGCMDALSTARAMAPNETVLPLDPPESQP